MSQEVIVNRTPETAGQVYERKLIEAQDMGFPIGQGLENLEQAAQATKIIEEVVPVAGFITDVGISDEEGSEVKVSEAEPPDTPYSPTAELISKALQNYAAPRDPDLKKFKEQVIKAFKELGLDTNKFFGV